jgi:hypothetical protein
VCRPPVELVYTLPLLPLLVLQCHAVRVQPSPDTVLLLCHIYCHTNYKVGDWKAVVDMHDSPIKSGTLNGLFAFITWRSAYWTRTVSLANKMLIPMYWFKSWVFGRDVGMF